VEKYGSARQAADRNIIRRVKDVGCMPDNQGNKADTEYLMLLLLMAVRNIL
jgi:hypothetical protein